MRARESASRRAARGSGVEAVSDARAFDISVAAGKGYESGRTEAVESITAMVQAFPPMAPKAIPIILENSDFPGAAALAKAMQPDPNNGMVPVEEAQKAQQEVNTLLKQSLDKLLAAMNTNPRVH